MSTFPQRRSGVSYNRATPLLLLMLLVYGIAEGVHAATVQAPWHRLASATAGGRTTDRRKLSVGKKILIAIGALGLAAGGLYAAHSRFRLARQGRPAGEPSSASALTTRPDTPLPVDDRAQSLQPAVQSVTPALAPEAAMSISGASAPAERVRTPSFDGESKAAELLPSDEPDIAAGAGREPEAPVSLGSWRERLLAFARVPDPVRPAHAPAGAAAPGGVLADDTVKTLGNLFEGAALEKVKTFLGEAFSGGAVSRALAFSEPIYEFFLAEHGAPWQESIAAGEVFFKDFFQLKQAVAEGAALLNANEMARLDALLESCAAHALRDQLLRLALERGFVAAYPAISPTPVERANAHAISLLFLKHKRKLKEAFYHYFKESLGVLEKEWRLAALVTSGRAATVPHWSDFSDAHLFALSECAYVPGCVREGALDAFQARKQKEGADVAPFMCDAFLRLRSECKVEALAAQYPIKVLLIEKYFPRASLTEWLQTLENKILDLAFIESYLQVKIAQCAGNPAYTDYYKAATAALAPPPDLLRVYTLAASHDLPLEELKKQQAHCKQQLQAARRERSREYHEACKAVLDAWPQSVVPVRSSMGSSDAAAQGSLFSLFVSEIEQIREQWRTGNSAETMLSAFLAKMLAVGRVWGLGDQLAQIPLPDQGRGEGILPKLRTHQAKAFLTSVIAPGLSGYAAQQAASLKLLAALAPPLNECIARYNRVLDGLSSEQRSGLYRKATALLHIFRAFCAS